MTNTIDEVLRELPTNELEVMKSALVDGLIEQKVLHKYWFFGKYNLVAVEGTDMTTLVEKHSENCLTKTSKNDVTSYFHYVLNAKIVNISGLPVSLASEFIENEPDPDYYIQTASKKLL